MPAGPHHEIADLRCERGELSFTARVGDVEQDVWMRTKSDVSPGAEAALCACLLPAMRFGGTLELPAALSPRLLRNQLEFQAVQEAWSRGWEFEDFRLSEVEVRAAAAEAAAPRPNGRVAAFFSGGVDSWSVVLDEPDLTDLVFVRGIDLIPRIPGGMEVANEVEERLRGAAEDLGLAFHLVETNLRELSDQIAPWETYFGCAAVSVALFLAPLFERVLIAGDSDYEVQVDSGANRMVDQLWSTEDLEIVEAGGRYSRVERLARICNHPTVQTTLRTCWENPDGIYNCGRCRKCLLTMVTLEALGARERVSTYPAELDLDAVAELTVERPVSLCLWEDVLDATRAANRPDLEHAVEQVVAKSKRALGLPLSYRRRALPGPPATPASTAIASAPPTEPRAFFATPETAEALSRAASAAVLVGSYDGSGNYGDIAQLDATLDLLRRHDPDLLALPVLERAHLGAHRELRDGFRRPFGHALFFGPGESHEDDLVPVLPPDRLFLATCFLYGGGYLNPSWGPRKLAMLGAAEELLAACGAPPCRLSSGLQVDREWIAGLGVDDARALRRFDLLGARDGGSVEALAALTSDAPVLDTGDDAVGLLRELSPAPGVEPGLELRVNVHIAEHEWVTGRPGGIAPYVAEVLAELGRRVERPVVAQPLIAYLDRRVDERPAVERLGEECAARGIGLEDARVLRPTSLVDAATTIRRAPLTVSCSYHVALTSLMLGVPAALIAENEYYRQKAAGLGEPFGLPPELTLDPGGDAAAAAAQLAGAALDDPARAEMARQLAAGAERLREKRVAAEEELLARLAHAPASQEHEVTDVEHRDGELSFVARIGGREQRVWMRAEGDAETSAGAVLPACLMPAMRFGGRLSLPVPVSPRVLRTQREFQAVQAAWSRGWEFGDPPLAEVEVAAPTAPPEPRPEAEGRVAAFFSGGVDSWSTVLGEPGLTDLIFVRGVDLMYGERRYADLADEVEGRLRGVATELGLGFHPVETNLRELSDPDIRWEAFFGCALDAVAHFVAPRFERVLLTGDSDHEAQAPIGASRLVDQLWSSERLDLVQVGGRHSRIERTRRIADNPLVQRTLRVCWENRDGAYNCGRCRKCIFTMVTLEALGMREAVETFPADLDLDLLDETEISQRIQLTLWEDVLDAIRATGRVDLAPPVARLIAGGKRNLGLPLSHRGRATPGPPPLRGYAANCAAATDAPDRR